MHAGSVPRGGRMIDKAGSRVHGPPASMPSFSDRPARPRGGGHGRGPAGRGPSPGMSRRVGIYRISPDVASRVTAGHPWVFRDALGSRELVEPPGTVVDIFSGNRDYIARGFVDRDHPVAVRVLPRNADEQVAPGLGIIAARFTRAAAAPPAPRAPPTGAC